MKLSQLVRNITGTRRILLCGTRTLLKTVFHVRGASGFGLINFYGFYKCWHVLTTIAWTHQRTRKLTYCMFPAQLVHFFTQASGLCVGMYHVNVHHCGAGLYKFLLLAYALLFKLPRGYRGQSSEREALLLPWKQTAQYLTLAEPDLWCMCECARRQVMGASRWVDPEHNQTVFACYSRMARYRSAQDDLFKEICRK